jgi:hypothetical protein
MELYIQGKGAVRLEQNDFVAKGGEGSVYARGKTAYKVYADPSRMIPAAKIKELSVLTDADIIRPEEILLDAGNVPVGYSMRRVQDANALCKLFTRSFRERKGVSPRQILALVRAFQATVHHIHDVHILVVDMNEMNFLVDRDLQRILCIDVDSYKTPAFPATAIMDSIRDRHSTGYSVETDWFSFAILTFQMFIGVHPYRGKHATLLDLDARMLANVSVLNRSVTMPPTAYPLDTIPAAYRDWYEALFEQGLRTPPPTGATYVPAVTPRFLHIPAAVRLKICEVGRFTAIAVSDVTGMAPQSAPITAMNTPGSAAVAILQVIDNMTALTTAGIFVRRALKLSWPALAQTHAACPTSPTGQARPTGSTVPTSTAGDAPHVLQDRILTVTPRQNRLVLAWRKDGRLHLWDVAAGKLIPCTVNADGLFASDGRLYLKQGGGLFELRWLELPSAVQPMLHPVANVLPLATRLYEGAAVQDILGSCHVSLFPRSGACHTVRIRELDGRRILDARYEHNVLMVASENKGALEISIIRFGDGYDDYDLRAEHDAGSTDVGFVTLDNGVCLWLNPQQELEVFSNRKGAAAIKVLNEPALHGVRLFKDGTRALFSRGDTLYEMTMTT